MKHALSLCGVSYEIAEQAAITDVSFAPKPGNLSVIIGPNGAGKSTLLRLAAGFLPPAQGRVQVGGRSLADLAAQERAALISYLPQFPDLLWPLTVLRTVSLGQHRRRGGQREAERAARRALGRVGLEAFAARSAQTLSGGEAIRMHLARTLAAETPIILADEPTAALDPKHQHQVMRILKAEARAGRTVVAVLHDLNLAAHYADHIVLMGQGTVTIEGPPHKVLTSELLGKAYGIGIQYKDGIVHFKP